MNQIEKVNGFQFEGHHVTQLTYNGRPCWIASEVGEVLGYAEGKQLSGMITGKWSDEFINGKDYQKLTGPDLNEIKELLSAVPQWTTAKITNLTILFESGLYLVLGKSRKEQGKLFRRFIVDEVMPQIARDGAYLPERAVVDDRLIVQKDKEIAYQERLFDLEQKKFESQQFKYLADLIRDRDEFGADVAYMYEVCSVEAATGQNLSHLKPDAPEKWLTCTEIGKKHGLSAQRIGKVTNMLGLKGKPGMSRQKITAGTGSKMEVEIWIYSPRAVEIIERELGSNMELF